MIILLSPAKTMNTDIPAPTGERTAPTFLPEAQSLVKQLAALSKAELQETLGVSDSLADLNYDRYQTWSPDMSVSRQAIYTYKGDAYQGFDAFTLDGAELAFAQHHLVVLSGLYGALRPLDAIHPYRLEMGGRFSPKNHSSLLGFWKKRVTAYLTAQLKADTHPWILNLASAEYAKAVDFKTLDVPVASPRFLEMRDGVPKQVSTFAKNARGLMARWAIQLRVNSPSQIEDFDEAGYAFDPEKTEAGTPIFIR